MKKVEKIVYIQTQFEGFHRWVDAPIDVAFLRNTHRHIFHVEVGVAVKGSNREVEFFLFKRKVDAFIKEKWEGQFFESSCEMIAEELLHTFDAEWVDVSEDKENGAFVAAIDDNSVDVIVEKPSIFDKREHCFYGTEAEGPNRGASVLFVPGSITQDVFKHVVGEFAFLPFQRIYYGAGNDRDIRLDTLAAIELYAHNRGLCVDIELDDLDNVRIVAEFMKAPKPGETQIEGVFVGHRPPCRHNIILFEHTPMGADPDLVDYMKYVTQTHIHWREVVLDKPQKFVTPTNDIFFQADSTLIPMERG